jgi:hypothetical protein
MKIEESIKKAMAQYLERVLTLTDVTVISWDEEFEKAYFTGCDTCGYGGEEDEYIVWISYTTPTSKKKYGKNYRYSGSFSELIRELDSASE